MVEQYLDCKSRGNKPGKNGDIHNTISISYHPIHRLVSSEEEETTADTPLAKNKPRKVTALQMRMQLLRFKWESPQQGPGKGEIANKKGRRCSNKGKDNRGNRVNPNIHRTPQHNTTYTNDKHHTICRTVSYDKEELEQSAAPTATNGDLRRRLTNNKPSQKATTLQRILQQLRVQVKGERTSTRCDNTPQYLPIWAEQRTSTKGDKSRRSISISRQKMGMIISHHRKKGMAGYDSA